jgi:arabinogalactan oligomer / maltooligosaccharide transport system permease protein
MSRTSLSGRRRSYRRQKQIGNVIRYTIAVLLILFAIFPIIWVISASINPIDSLGSQRLIPREPSLENYQKLLTENEFSAVFPFKRWFINSFKIATITTIISVSITTLAAYAFSRFRFRQRENMLRSILLIQVFPNLLAVVAVFLLIQQIGDIMPVVPRDFPDSLANFLGVAKGGPFIGLNTHTALILVHLGGSMGINIWLMKGFFDSIPRDIDESAMVDGATHWQIFSRLLLPLMRPIIVVVALLSFIFVYGDFILANVLLKTTTQYPLTVGLYIFTSGQFSQQWGVFAAGALMGAVPIMIVYLVLQDQIVGGLTAGSVKG